MKRNTTITALGTMLVLAAVGAVAFVTRRRMA